MLPHCALLQVLKKRNGIQVLLF